MLTVSTTHPYVTFGRAGLLLGAKTRLAHFVGGTDVLAVDPARLQALFAIAFQRAPSSRELTAIDAAATHWQRGDGALANLRLVFADLPRLDEPEDAVRLKAAELLFDAGLRADDLAAVLDDAPPADGFEKYDPNQPASRPEAATPVGSGRRSGAVSALGWTSRCRSTTKTPVSNTARNHARGRSLRAH